MDCNPVYYFGDNEKQRKEYFKRAMSDVMTGVPRHVRRSRRRQLEAKRPEMAATEMKNAFLNAISKTAVTCFSTLPDNILMWSHYADSHRGICFVFDNNVSEPHWVPFEVKYETNRPRINATKLRDVETMEQALLCKSADWSYESEYRMIDWRGGPGFRDFPRDNLVGVILGARMQDDDLGYLSGLLSKRPELDLFRAEIDDSDFKINLSQIDLSAVT